MAAKATMRISQNSISRVQTDFYVREPGSGMSSHHFHPYYELFYVEEGGVRFLIDSSFYDLQRGDFILIPPQTFHATTYPTVRCQRYNLYFRSEDISQQALSCLPEAGDFFTRARLFHVPERAAKSVRELLERMLSEQENSDRQLPYFMYFYLQELFLLIARVCAFTQELPEGVSVSDAHSLRAARFIGSNYMNPISSADIAAAAGFSPNHLSRKFREAIGVGVHEYLMQTRLQHAALELVTTEDTITQIALRCGFSDSNYFKDVFKKKYGMTPREYRKNR